MAPDDQPSAEELERFQLVVGAKEGDDLLQEIMVALAEGRGYDLP